MAQSLPPYLASHVRSSRYAQRERPAASIPSRIRARQASAGAPGTRLPATSPTASLFIAPWGPPF